MAALLAPLSSMVAAKLISSSTKVTVKVKVGGCHRQASFFDNVNIIGNILTIIRKVGSIKEIFVPVSLQFSLNVKHLLR